MASKKKIVAGVSELVASIQSHLTEVVPGYALAGPASEADLQALAEAAGAALHADLLAFFRASDGIAVPDGVPDLAPLLSCSDVLAETRKAREGAEGAPAMVVLEYQDYESAVHAFVLDGNAAGQVARWDSVEQLVEDYDASPLPTFLATFLTTLKSALPSPKDLAKKIERIAKDGRAGKNVAGVFDKFANPEVLLRAVLEQVPDAPTWINPEYEEHILRNPLARYGHYLPVELLVKTAGKLSFTGVVTLLHGHAPLADSLLANAYTRDPEATVRAAAELEGPARDGWLLMQRRMGLVDVSAIPPELRARLAVSARRYRVVTPKDGAVVESPANGLDALTPYFESREDLLGAVRKAPPEAATTPDVAEVLLGVASSAPQILALANEIYRNGVDVPDGVWHRIPFATLVDTAKNVEGGDWLARVGMSHPQATPQGVAALTSLLQEQPSA